MPQALPERFNFAQQGNTNNYATSARGAYQAFFDSNIQPDWVHIDNIDEYPAIYLSYPVMLTQKTVARLAELLAGELRADPLVAKVDVAGPGFINLTLKPEAWTSALRSAILSGPDYGASHVGGGQPVNVEYVSANPTGPLHVGHTRGAVFGDALASLLGFTGFAVTREHLLLFERGIP